MLLKAWKAEERPLLTSSPKVIITNRRTFKLNLESGLIANQAEVRSTIEDEHIEFVDSLSEVNYSGQFSMYPRAGHIKAVINLDSANMVDETNHFIDRDEPNLIFANSVAASSTAFSLVNAGYKNVSVYMGSLQEWTADPKNPMTVGE